VSRGPGSRRVKLQGASGVVADWAAYPMAFFDTGFLRRKESLNVQRLLDQVWMVGGGRWIHNCRKMSRRSKKRARGRARYNFVATNLTLLACGVPCRR